MSRSNPRAYTPMKWSAMKSAGASSMCACNTAEQPTRCSRLYESANCQARASDPCVDAMRAINGKTILDQNSELEVYFFFPPFLPAGGMCCGLLES